MARGSGLGDGVVGGALACAAGAVLTAAGEPPHADPATRIPTASPAQCLATAFCRPQSRGGRPALDG